MKGADEDKHSALATLLPNPAWRLVWALSTLKDADERIQIEGLMERVAGPTEAEGRFLDAIPFDDEALHATHGVERFVTGVTGRDALERHLYQPTCTICGIESGYTGPGSKTVLPHLASAKLDFRLVPDLTPELVATCCASTLTATALGTSRLSPTPPSIRCRARSRAPWCNRRWQRSSR